MKQCINNQCKHELDDYQERCPYCGWSQKSFKRVTPQNVGELQDKVKLNEDPLRKRHGCVTTYIFISIFVGIITSVIFFFPKEFWGSRFPDAAVPMSIVAGCYRYCCCCHDACLEKDRFLFTLCHRYSLLYHYLANG